jgi:hypothetical protein
MEQDSIHIQFCIRCNLQLAPSGKRDERQIKGPKGFRANPIAYYALLKKCIWTDFAATDSSALLLSFDFQSQCFRRTTFLAVTPYTLSHLETHIKMGDRGSSIKTVVVGDGAVGKTSLLLVYATNEFPEKYVFPTFGEFLPFFLFVPFVILTRHVWLFVSAGTFPRCLTIARFLSKSIIEQFNYVCYCRSVILGSSYSLTISDSS